MPNYPDKIKGRTMGNIPNASDIKEAISKNLKINVNRFRKNIIREIYKMVEKDSFTFTIYFETSMDPERIVLGELVGAGYHIEICEDDRDHSKSLTVSIKSR